VKKPPCFPIDLFSICVDFCGMAFPGITHLRRDTGVDGWSTAFLRVKTAVTLLNFLFLFLVQKALGLDTWVTVLLLSP